MAATTTTTLTTKYPIAELFHSLQGEGAYTGTPMMFIRLAGCNVGEYTGYPSGAEPFEPYLKDGPFPILKDQDLGLLRSKKHSICTTVSGERFLCDTDYHRAESMSIVGLIEDWEARGEGHVCITGGEPFLHNLTPLITAFQTCMVRGERVMTHIETSGTLPLSFPGQEAAFNAPTSNFRRQLWITCAPKQAMLKEVLSGVDEVKILVGDTMNEDWLERFVLALESYPRLERDRIYLQPINGVNDERDESLQFCLKLLRRFPSLRLSAQLHKYIHQR